MSQTLTKPILLDETGQAIKTALQNIEDVHSEMDDNIASIAGSLEDIKNILNLSSRTPTKISITSPPDKTTYGAGERLTLEGLVVCASMTNGIDTILCDITSQCTFNPRPPQILTNETEVVITWTYNEQTFTVRQPITVTVVKIVNWSDGSIEDINAMLAAHYNPNIDFDIHDYWSVGDIRIVPLSSVKRWIWSTGGASDESTHAAQNIELVLLNEGGKELVTPINGVTECAYIIGQNKCLEEDSTFGNKEEYYDNNTFDAQWDWSTSLRRTWCNNDYKNALPSDIRTLFKEFKNVTGQYGTSSTVTTQDYFALPSEKEVYGTNYYGDSTAESSNTQFLHYQRSSNNYHELKPNYSTREWWTRTRAVKDDDSQSITRNYISMVYELHEGSYGMISYSPSNGAGIRPFGVI